MIILTMEGSNLFRLPFVHHRIRCIVSDSEATVAVGFLLSSLHLFYLTPSNFRARAYVICETPPREAKRQSMSRRPEASRELS